jgi:hypothetical protein
VKTWLTTGGPKVFQAVKEQRYGGTESVCIERWFFRVAGMSVELSG